MGNKIYIYDTTLRDGAQTEGVSYSLEDKIRIAKKLDQFHIDFIEGGWPSSNPKDKELFNYFKKRPLRYSQLVAFGSTRRAHIKPYQDINLKGLVSSGTHYITIFGKSWDLHVKEALRTSLEENLLMIRDSLKFLRKKHKKVFYDAEHFFDGYKNNPNYALKTILVAQEEGAQAIILCDTNGGTLPQDVGKIIGEISKHIKIPLGIHAHNDSGLALANSITAVQEGCIQVQGTINGLGERCGNADLCQVIGVLQVKMGKKCLEKRFLSRLYELSHFIWEMSNLKPQDNQPFVGKSAFAHKGGVHINAVLKNPLTYEHIRPEWVGNKRRILLSELSGKTGVINILRSINIQIEKTSPQARKLYRILQEREMGGYSFEVAEGSFKTLVARKLKKYRKFFELLGFRVIVEKREGRLIAEATVKLKIGNTQKLVASEGDGPVNALDSSLRKALEEIYPSLSQMHLVDFKVRVLDERQGTAAKVRVLITSQDERDTWTTVGVSENIIEASWQALVDSIEYKLLKDANLLE